MLFVTQDGVQSWLCDSCLGPLLPFRSFSTFASEFQRGVPDTARCPYCGTTKEDVQSTGLVGCPLCYDALPGTLWKEFGIARGKWTKHPMI